VQPKLSSVFIVFPEERDKMIPGWILVVAMGSYYFLKKPGKDSRDIVAFARIPGERGADPPEDKEIQAKTKSSGHLLWLVIVGVPCACILLSQLCLWMSSVTVSR
jgi:hypothetical protein